MGKTHRPSPSAEGNIPVHGPSKASGPGDDAQCDALSFPTSCPAPSLRHRGVLPLAALSGPPQRLSLPSPAVFFLYLSVSLPCPWSISAEAVGPPGGLSGRGVSPALCLERSTFQYYKPLSLAASCSCVSRQTSPGHQTVWIRRGDKQPCSLLHLPPSPVLCLIPLNESSTLPVHF